MSVHKFNSPTKYPRNKFSLLSKKKKSILLLFSLAEYTFLLLREDEHFQSILQVKDQDKLWVFLL